MKPLASAFAITLATGGFCLCLFCLGVYLTWTPIGVIGFLGFILHAILSALIGFGLEEIGNDR